MIKEINMFKKTLIAVATAAALSTAAQAATVSATKDVYSKEGSAGITVTSYASPDFTVTLGAEYQVGDILTVTFGADLVDVPTSVVSSNPDVTVGFLNKTANTAVYRVTQNAGTNTTTIGDVLTFSGFTFDDDSVETAGSVSVAYTAETATGQVIDSAGTNNAVLVQVIDTLSVAVTTAADAVIDVANDRTKFANSVTEDEIVVEITNNTTDILNAVNVAEAVYTISGDFSWVVNDAVVSANTGATVESVSADQVVVSATTEDAVTVTFTPALNIGTGETAPTQLIAASEFTVDVAISYSSGTSTVVDTTEGLDAGEWALNGATRVINAMPIGDDVQNFVWIGNDGPVAGAITATAIYGGEIYGPYDLGTAAAKANTPIGLALSQALAADGVDSGRAEVTVSVTAPSENININASYKVSSANDRLTLSVDGNPM
jgi:hypothetical protein